MWRRQRQKKCTFNTNTPRAKKLLKPHAFIYEKKQKQKNEKKGLICTPMF